MLTFPLFLEPNKLVCINGDDVEVGGALTVVQFESVFHRFGVRDGRGIGTGRDGRCLLLEKRQLSACRRLALFSFFDRRFDLVQRLCSGRERAGHVIFAVCIGIRVGIGPIIEGQICARDKVDCEAVDSGGVVVRCARDTN